MASTAEDGRAKSEAFGLVVYERIKVQVKVQIEIEIVNKRERECV